MSCERLRTETFQRIQGEQSSGHVTGGGDKTSMYVRMIVYEQGRWNVLRVRRPLNAQHFVVMASVGAVQIERSKLSDEMIGRAPNLDVRVMGDCDVSIDNVSLIEETNRSPLYFYTHFPSGENSKALTGFWKLKWCKMAPLLKLTSKARPSEVWVRESIRRHKGR